MRWSALVVTLRTCLSEDLLASGHRRGRRIRFSSGGAADPSIDVVRRRGCALGTRGRRQPRTVALVTVVGATASGRESDASHLLRGGQPDAPTILPGLANPSRPACV